MHPVLKRTRESGGGEDARRVASRRLDPAHRARAASLPLQVFSHYPAQPAPVDVRLFTSEPHDCPYLPDRVAVSRAFLVHRLNGELYHEFMDAGFRRSGIVIYQNVCPGCRQCVPLRVPVSRFTPTKSHRRCQRRNADLSINVAAPVPTGEKFDLYSRYCAEWHGKVDGDQDSFEAFLYDSPVETIEFEYRDATKRLIAIGICDLCPRSLSSVYFYFDPRDA